MSFVECPSSSICSPRQFALYPIEIQGLVIDIPYRSKELRFRQLGLFLFKLLKSAFYSPRLDLSTAILYLSSDAICGSFKGN